MAAIRARSNLIAHDQSINSFVNPLRQKGTFTQNYSDNLVVKEGSTIDLTWISNYTLTVLTISQVLNCAEGELDCNSNSTLPQSIPKSPNIASWTVDSSPYNLTESSIFCFTIYNGSTRNDIASFTSRYFNISTSNDIPPVTDTAPSLSTKRHEVADPVSTIDLPVGAEVAIGLGIGVVSCAVVLTIALLFRHIKRSRRRSHAAENQRIGSVNAEDNLWVSRESWVQALGMRQNTSDEVSTSQYRWDSPDDVMSRYDTPDLGRERGIFDEVHLKNSEEYIHSQNNQDNNPTWHIHLAPGEGVASHCIDNPCGTWTNSLTEIFQVPGDASSNFQQHQSLVPPENPQPTPRRSTQLERYIPRQNSIKPQHPMPTYAPWHHPELINRTNSMGSIQKTPTQFQSRSQAKEKQELNPNANRERVLKEGYTTSFSTDHDLSVSTKSFRIKQNLETTPKRKSKDYTPRQISQLMSPSVFDISKREQPPSLPEGLQPKATHGATYQKQDQKQEQEKDQLPHPLKSHPQSQCPLPSQALSQTKSSIQDPTLIPEQSYSKSGTQYPGIPELEISELEALNSTPTPTPTSDD